MARGAATTASADTTDEGDLVDKSCDEWCCDRRNGVSVVSVLVAVLALSISASCGAQSVDSDAGDGFRTVVAQVRGIT
jgi:hypothetical protein